MMLIFVLFVGYLFSYSLLDWLNYESFIYFNKYIFFVLILLFVNIILSDYQNSKRLVSAAEKVFLLNSFLVILGLMFNIQVFESFYFMDYRFGYSGLFLSANEYGYSLMSMLLVTYYKNFIEGESSYSFYIFLLVAVISGLKAVYIFTAFLFLYHIFSRRSLSLFTIVGITSILFAASAGFLFENIFHEDAVGSLGFYKNYVENRGVFDMLTSSRFDFIDTRLLPQIKEWGVFQFIFGGRHMSVEMDFIDIFLFFGIIGGLIYLILISTVLVSSWGSCFIVKFFIALILVLSFFGGHLFYSATGAMYLGIILSYISMKERVR